MLSENLKMLREKSGLKQSEVASKIGVSRVTYTHYELGKREPDTNTLVVLSNVFNVSVDFLLGKKENTQSEYSDEEYKDFFAMIKNFRSKRRFTISEVANFLNISKSEYKEIESGAKRPNEKIVARICELYDVTESFMFGKEFQMGKDLIDPAILKVELTDKDLREVSLKAELAKTAMLSVLEATFDNPKDPDTIKKINAAIDEAHILAKKAAKAKYTPFKFRK